jgi:hypothetical protein
MYSTFISLLTAYALAASPAHHVPDTLDVRTLASAPRLDGHVDEAEYGAPTLLLRTAEGEAKVWVARTGGWLHIAAVLPDSTYYWGDDLVISLDADGSADAAPSTGDRQWYLRRTLDSSFVVTADSGRWFRPGHPPPVLGATRQGDDWEVASRSMHNVWTVELRIRETALRSGPALPRIAFRTYNDRPHGWWSFPAPAADAPAHSVERNPQSWMPFRLR